MHVAPAAALRTWPPRWEPAPPRIPPHRRVVRDNRGGVNFLTIPKVAIRAIAQNTMRSALTALGVIIGVAAVICTVAIGEGASARIEQAIVNIGANMIWIEAGGVNRGGVRTGAYGTKTLTVEDFRAIQDQVSLVTNVSPHVDTRVQLIFGNQNWNSTVRGVSPAYLAVKGWDVVRGGMFTDVDIERAGTVCVLGQTIVDQLFGDQNPIGETVRVKDQPCQVIGVLAVKGQSATGQDQDDTFLMPYSTVMKKVKGQTWLDDIMCTATSAAAVDRAEDEITSLLHERHHIKPGADNDFNLRHPTEIAEAVKQSTQTMELLLAAIASVSLLVGGIGIMNIMLVSVTERTREIGIRMAIGAKGRDVRAQFLVEAVILSLLGGTLGIVAGIAGSRTIANMLTWPTRVSPAAILLAFGFSAAIGVFFGFYPASKAAGLDPIEALRFE
jgi:putative ABC transport system permease protein